MNTPANTATRTDGESLLNNHADIESQYVASINLFDQALNIEPDNVDVLINKGISLQKLARLYSALNDSQRASIFYEESIALFDQALLLAPTNVIALNGKGVSFRDTADLQQSHNHSQKQLSSTYDKLIQDGLVGTATADSNLSSTYKALLYKD